MATDDRAPRGGGPAPVRIGDAERQRMTELLQQHLAAGRLDMPEFERRVEHATSAVYERDLAGLLDDLPPLDADGEPAGSRHRRDRGDRADERGWDQPDWWPPRPRGRTPWRRGVPFPLLALGVVALVVATHGWILFPLLFLFVAARGGCRRWDAGRHTQHGRHGRHGEGPSRDRDREHAGWHDTPTWPGRYEPSDDDRRM